MKLIFLDIDGVLNSYRSMFVHGPMKDWHNGRWTNMDPMAVKMLMRLCKETDAKIVISSTWRKLFTLEEFLEAFKKTFDWDIPIVGMTPRSSTGWRGDEIDEWLRTTEYDVEAYVVLDDDSDMNEHQPFVNVNAIHGLSMFDIHRMWVVLDPENEHPRKFLEDHEEWECKCHKEHHHTPRPESLRERENDFW